MGMFDAIKLGSRVVDLLERGVVALEKLAGTEVRCLHEWRDFGSDDDEVCSKCAEVRRRPEKP
jgi:hypothetical protein